MTFDTTDWLPRSTGELHAEVDRHRDPAPGRLPATARLGSVIVLRQADGSSARLDMRAEAALDRAASSAGVPLPADVRARFESSLGADLSRVRLHTGADSAAAARSVGAHAYTIGDAIHFAAGRFAPTDPFGLHLLAHEVAHTVQQQGSDPVRANKLEVSAPGDAAELEADRAADAMVRGDRASVGLATGAAIWRGKDTKSNDEDKAWAIDLRTKVWSVRDAAQQAAQVASDDAAAASTALKTAQTSFSTFESQYDDAVDRFTTHVKRALAVAAQLRQGIELTAELLVAAGSGGPGLIGELAAAGNTLQNLETGIQLVAMQVGTTASAPAANPQPDVAPGPSAQVNWKALISTSIASFDGFAQRNTSLLSILASCSRASDFLTNVVEGVGGDDARHSPEGLAAQKFDGADMMRAQLALVSPGAISSKAADFATKVSGPLDAKSKKPTEIEQDIAMKWLAGLSEAEIGAIDDAGDYLASLGVMDNGGGRTGVDAGVWRTYWDKALVAARARAEAWAATFVGSTVTYFKDAQAINVEGRNLKATGAGTVCDPGETALNQWPVQIAKYDVGSLTADELSNVQHLGSGRGDADEIAKKKVSFEVVPVVQPDSGLKKWDGSKWQDAGEGPER